MASTGAVKGFIRNLLSIILISSLGYYIWSNWEKFLDVFDASWQQIAGLTLCIVLTWFVTSLQSLLLFRQVGIEIKFRESFILSMAMVMGNHLPMRFGSFLRIHYLKKIHGLHYAKSVGIAGVKFLVLLVLSCTIVVIGLVAREGLQPFFSWIFLVALVATTVVVFMILLLPRYQIEKPSNFLSRTLSEFLGAFSILQSRPILCAQIAGLVLTRLLLLAIRLHICFQVIDADLAPEILLILASASTLVSFLSLTPGNLGLREWTIGIITLALGIDFSNGIIAATLDRGVLLLCTFILGPAPLAYVWVRTTK